MHLSGSARAFARLDRLASVDGTLFRRVFMQGNKEPRSKAGSWQGYYCLCLCAAQRCPSGICAADLPGQLWPSDHNPHDCCSWYATIPPLVSSPCQHYWLRL